MEHLRQYGQIHDDIENIDIYFVFVKELSEFVKSRLNREL